MDGQGRTKQAQQGHKQDIQGTPTFLYISNLILLAPPHSHPPEHEKHARLGVFLVLPNSDMFCITYNPRKQVPWLVFGEVDLSSATTTTHSLLPELSLMS
jgi:hypothetical protein